MSRLPILFALSFLGTSVLQARLGESPEKLLERFGKPIQQSPAGVGDLRQHVYVNKDLMVTVLLTGNESVLEQYVRFKEIPKEGQKPLLVPIPEPLAMAILAANKEGSDWEAFESTSTFDGSSGKIKKALLPSPWKKGSSVKSASARRTLSISPKN